MGSAPLAKKPRLEGVLSGDGSHGAPSIGEIKKRLADKLEDKQEAKLSINKDNLKNLSDNLTKDKIAEIRAKLISNRRTRIKPEDADDAKTSIGALDLGDISREAKDIFSRERLWRTRTTILQSSGKVNVTVYIQYKSVQFVTIALKI